MHALTPKEFAARYVSNPRPRLSSYPFVAKSRARAASVRWTAQRHKVGVERLVGLFPEWSERITTITSFDSCRTAFEVYLCKLILAASVPQGEQWALRTYVWPCPTCGHFCTNGAASTTVYGPRLRVKHSRYKPEWIIGTNCTRCISWDTCRTCGKLHPPNRGFFLSNGRRRRVGSLIGDEFSGKYCMACANVWRPIYARMRESYEFATDLNRFTKEVRDVKRQAADDDR